MSLGEADGKFPTANQGAGLPPLPTRENPGRVFPKSDPQSGRPFYVLHLTATLDAATAPLTPIIQNIDPYIGNPYLMGGTLRKVDKALSEVIAILESEERSHSGANEEGPLLQKFRRWRDEILSMRGDSQTPPGTTSRASTRTRSRTRSRSPEAGGMFVD
ncbi:hypothetical protein H2248_002496 [Termitomyces sp. 'cryptogamus']|nr:hypothetical protein H2248_002496 [Termitomyces sp. 'cryptogamus']